MKRFRPLLLLAVAALLLAACGDDDATSDDDSAAPETTSAPTTTEAPVTTTPPADTGPATVAVAEVAGVGEALVDGDGLTLYLFDQDDGTSSACTGACADAWPALVADGEPAGGDGVDASLLSTADGQVPDHVAYNGHLLYTFSGDSAPGDANGVGLPGWFPVDPAGNAIQP
jgi:predicted lipoprotein with Yx(FWY)xxD motif